MREKLALMMRRFLDQPVWVRVLRGIGLAAIVTVLAVYTPTPYILQAPGRTVPASSIIVVKDKDAHRVNGQFLMTTVLTEKASVMLCLYGLLDPDATLTRSLQTDASLQHAQSPPESGQMELSQYLSSRVALESLGYPVQGKYLGLRILGFHPSSPNLDRLKPGDLIVKLGGEKLPTMKILKALLDKSSAGDQVAAVLEREGKTLDADLKIASIDGSQRIGAAMRPEYGAVQLPVEIVFTSGNTSGASAGLVFALEIYDQLSSKDLAKGRVIAATGTLDGAGRVGGIQGIPFKLIAAERAGATIFLVPSENWNEIRNTSTSLQVIPISTFAEALDALEK